MKFLALIVTRSNKDIFKETNERWQFEENEEREREKKVKKIGKEQ